MDDEWPLLMKGDCLLSAVACGSSSQDFSFSSSKEFESTQNYISLSTPQHSSYTPLDSTESSPFTETLPNSQKYLNLPAENNFTLPPYSTATTKLDTQEEPNYNQFVQSQCSPCSSTFSSSDQDALSVGFEKPYSNTPNEDVYGILLNVDDSLSLPADITPYARNRYETTSTTSTNDTLSTVPQFSHTNINQQSHYTATKCFNERIESPSPPSSDCSSSLESPAPILPCKARSKMHEMAVKQRLITDQDPRGNGFIQLSAEEKRTLIQEGYSLPTRLPLTKSEEDALKIVRRKIKNKLSAQESRRKRKEYMDTLEQRVQLYFSENSSLKAKIKQLEQNNRNLIVQLKKMQAAMNNANVVTQAPCLTTSSHLPHTAGIASVDTAKAVN